LVIASKYAKEKKVPPRTVQEGKERGQGRDRTAPSMQCDEGGRIWGDKRGRRRSPHRTGRRGVGIVQANAAGGPWPTITRNPVKQEFLWTASTFEQNLRQGTRRHHKGSKGESKPKPDGTS